MRLIEKLFGNPYQNKIFKFFYWFGVVLFIVYIPSIIFICVSISSIILFIYSIMGIIFYPLIFRLVYGISVHLYRIIVSGKRDK